jgi:hypothetical protein
MDEINMHACELEAYYNELASTNNIQQYGSLWKINAENVRSNLDSFITFYIQQGLGRPQVGVKGFEYSTRKGYCFVHHKVSVLIVKTNR